MALTDNMQATRQIADALKSGQAAEAERLCREQLRLAADDRDLLLLFALSLQQQGRLRDALAPYKRLTELESRSGLHLCNYASALEVAGDSTAATRVAETAARLDPQNSEVLQQLGLLYLQLHRLPDAREVLLQAHALAPQSPLAKLHAARACVACRDPRATTLLAGWREWPRFDEQLQCELAEALMQTGAMSDAIRVLQVMMTESGASIRALLLLASAYQRVNRLEVARDCLMRVMSDPAMRKPGIRREVNHQLAQLDLRAHRYLEAVRQLESDGPLDRNDYDHYFLLGAAYDGLDRTADALTALERAHAAQVAEIHTYAGHLATAPLPLLPYAGKRLDASSLAKWPRLTAPDSPQLPVFIVGFPRSGTTLLEQMLDAHENLQSMDEQPFLRQLADRLTAYGVKSSNDLALLGQRDCDELRKDYLAMAGERVGRQWHGRLVDKNPLNMTRLAFIRRLFPQAKIVFAVRDPRDVVLSCYMQNFQSSPLAVVCKSLQSIAHAYVSVMQNWSYHAALFENAGILTVRYEKLVSNTEEEVQRIARFLNLDGYDQMLHFDAHAQAKGFISTPSYAQVVQPISAGRIARWQKYGPQFAHLLPILQSTLEQWGYGESR
jgi:Flp pilus assembly protein TadD